MYHGTTSTIYLPTYLSTYLPIYLSLWWQFGLNRMRSLTPVAIHGALVLGSEPPKI